MDAIENQINDILDQEVIEERHAIDGKLLIAISLCKIMVLDVFLYGVDTNLYMLIHMLEFYGMNLQGIIVSDKEAEKKVESYGIPLIAYGDFRKKYRDVQNKFVFFASPVRSCGILDFYHWRGKKHVRKVQDRLETRKLSALLSDIQIKYYHVLTDSDWKVFTSNTEHWIDANRIFYYKKNRKEIIEFGRMLEDSRSQQTLCDYLRSYMTNSAFGGAQIQTRYKYWYGDNQEELYRHLDDECWVNCGASVGDTLLSFLSWGFKYEKILAFEGATVAFAGLKETLGLLPDEEMKKKIVLFNQFIDEKGDHMQALKRERCSLLNADIEGNELSLLKSMREIIRRDRPVIAISLYHKKEDIVEIPQYLGSIAHDYVFKLRKYTSWFMNFNRNHELVFYAIPRERNVGC